MQVQNPRRTLFIGIAVWLLFFGWWFRGFLFRNWQFRLFSYRSWYYLFHEFRAGWRLSSKSDWIFLFSFFMAPIIFVLLWWLIEKFRWGALCQKIWNVLKWPFSGQKKNEPKVAEATYSPKQSEEPLVYRPQVMPSSGSFTPNTNTEGASQRTFLNSTTAMGDFSGVGTEPPRESQRFSGGQGYPPSFNESKGDSLTNEDFADMADTPLSDIQIPKMEPVKEDIPALLTGGGYVMLPEEKITNEKVDFMAACAKEVWVALYDKEEGDWLADEESFNDEDPLWFSETDHRISPVFRLKTKADLLKQKLGNEFQIHPVLIEQKGTIINAEDMMKTWNDMGVTVCRTASGGPVELPTVSEILKEPQEKISEEILEKIKALL